MLYIALILLIGFNGCSITNLFSNRTIQDNESEYEIYSYSTKDLFEAIITSDSDLLKACLEKLEVAEIGRSYSFEERKKNTKLKEIEDDSELDEEGKTKFEYCDEKYDDIFSKISLLPTHGEESFNVFSLILSIPIHKDVDSPIFMDKETKLDIFEKLICRYVSPPEVMTQFKMEGKKDIFGLKRFLKYLILLDLEDKNGEDYNGYKSMLDIYNRKFKGYFEYSRDRLKDTNLIDFLIDGIVTSDLEYVKHCLEFGNVYKLVLREELIGGAFNRLLEEDGDVYYYLYCERKYDRTFDIKASHYSIDAESYNVNAISVLISMPSDLDNDENVGSISKETRIEIFRMLTDFYSYDKISEAGIGYYRTSDKYEILKSIDSDLKVEIYSIDGKNFQGAFALLEYMIQKEISLGREEDYSGYKSMLNILKAKKEAADKLIKENSKKDSN